jgi:hypothetical protein
VCSAFERFFLPAFEPLLVRFGVCAAFEQAFALALVFL